MENDPFNRIPDPPLSLPQPTAPSKFVGDYQLETPPGAARASAGAEDPVTSDELHLNNGTISIDIDANGVVVTNLFSGYVTKLDNAGAIKFVVGGGTNTITVGPTGFTLYNGVSTVSILFADLTHNMGIKTIDVCDSGTPKQMIVLGSDPF